MKLLNENALLYLGQLVITQVELLQPGPPVDRPTQIQISDAVLTEHQLSEVVGLPKCWAGQDINAVGSHVY